MAQQFAEGGCRLCRFHLLEDGPACPPRNDNSRVDDELLGQIVQRLYVMQERLLYKVALLYPGRSDVLLDQILGLL